MALNEGKVDWNDTSVTASMNQLFKLEESQTARICILGKQALMGLDHYSEATRRHARCIRSKSACPGCEHLGDPKERFATKILVYGTDKAGNLLKPFSMAVQVFVFSADKFVALREIRKQWGDLSQRDLLVSCPKGGQKFQKMTFIPAPKCLWLTNDATKAKAKQLFAANKVDLDSILGKALSAEEMAKRLGLVTEPATFDETELEAGLDLLNEPAPSPEKVGSKKGAGKGAPAVEDLSVSEIDDVPVDDVPAEDAGADPLSDIDEALGALGDL